MNPCRFLKGRDALAAPFPSRQTPVKVRSEKKRELPEHHLHASTCGPSSRERVGQRTRTPATEHNDQEAHATVTGRKRKMRRPKSPHPPPKPTRQHCAPQPMLEVSQCRFGPKDKEEERERAEGRSSNNRPNPTQHALRPKIIIVNGRHGAWK